MKVALYGLGSMGHGMARSLLRAGHEVAGFDIAPQAVARFREEGGLEEAAETLAPSLDAVVVVVLNAQQTRAVLFGENGIAARLRAGAVVIACATVAPDFAREMEQACAQTGLLYLDAPISGGAEKAANGQLSIMASGSPEAFEASRELLAAMAERVFELGDAAGAGSAMKSVNQLLAGVHIAAMGEALAFALAQGISPARTLDVISRCAGTSWMFENRAPHVASGDYTPRSAVRIWLKDLGIVEEVAKSRNLPTPLTGAALAQFVAAADAGLAEEDDAAVTKVYARAAGLTLPHERE